MLGEVFVLNYEVSINLKLSHELKEAYKKCLNMDEIYETHILHQSKAFENFSTNVFPISYFIC